jgi:hypothetical protein
MFGKHAMPQSCTAAALQLGRQHAITPELAMTMSNVNSPLQGMPLANEA